MRLKCNIPLIQLFFFVTAALGWEFYKFGDYIARYVNSGVLPPDSFEAAIADKNIGGAIDCSPILLSLMYCFVLLIILTRDQHIKDKVAISKNNLFSKKPETQPLLMINSKAVILGGGNED
jgi:hypothetical protein